MPKVAYQLIAPVKRTTSVVFASPHSGRDYSRRFLQRSILDEHTIRSSEDAFVDKLFAAVPQHGAPLLLAGAPRAFIDLNRSADELDPALISDGDVLAITDRDGATFIFEADSGYQLMVPEPITLVVPGGGTNPGALADGDIFEINDGINPLAEKIMDQ